MLFPRRSSCCCAPEPRPTDQCRSRWEHTCCGASSHSTDSRKHAPGDSGIGFLNALECRGPNSLRELWMSHVVPSKYVTRPSPWSGAQLVDCVSEHQSLQNDCTCSSCLFGTRHSRWQSSAGHSIDLSRYQARSSLILSSGSQSIINWPNSCRYSVLIKCLS